jgi:predicted ATPase
MSEAHPVFIALEDLHWSDDTSLDLFHFLARRVGGYPLLLVGTYCSEEISPSLARLLAELNRARASTEIQLELLTREQVTEVVRAILEIERPIKSDFLDVIVPLTEDNPFSSKKFCAHSIWRVKCKTPRGWRSA